MHTWAATITQDTKQGSKTHSVEIKANSSEMAFATARNFHTDFRYGANIVINYTGKAN